MDKTALKAWLRHNMDYRETYSASELYAEFERQIKQRHGDQLLVMKEVSFTRRMNEFSSGDARFIGRIRGRKGLRYYQMIPGHIDKPPMSKLYQKSMELIYKGIKRWL